MVCSENRKCIWGTYLRIILILLLLVLRCSLHIADTGSGTNTGNGIVIGTILDMSGLPAQNTEVTLIPELYNPVLNDSLPDSLSTLTDSDGKYRIIAGDSGVYNIQANHRAENTALLIQHVEVTTDITLVPRDSLKETGVIRFSLPDSVKSGYIYIPGTLLKAAIDSTSLVNGFVIISAVPSAIIPAVNYIPENSAEPVLLEKEISVESGDTAKISNDEPYEMTEQFFFEHFDDSGFVERGWYDMTNLKLSTVEHVEGSKSSAEYLFKTGSDVTTPSSVIRTLFTETESVYVSFYIKYSENWVGSGTQASTSSFVILTNEDDKWAGPGRNPLMIAFRYANGKCAVHLQDSKNIDTANIDVDLSNVTEYRAVAGCNGNCDGYGEGDCTNDGTYYVNNKAWITEKDYFTDLPGPLYKNDWHHIEIFIKLNSLQGDKGVADGIIMHWYDGKLLMNHDHVMMRTGKYKSIKFNQFMIVPFIKDGSPVDQTFWVDNLTVGR